MADLKIIEVPFSAIELAKTINDNNAVLDDGKAAKTDLGNYIPTNQKSTPNGVAALDENSEVAQNAKTATEAKNYDTAQGNIKTKFGETDSAIASITNGNTIVGKARTLEPLTPPGNDKVYGTSPSGVVGWYDMPSVDGEVKGVYSEPFTATDARWGAVVADVYTLTIPHAGGYPVAAYKQDGANYAMVSVDIQRDNTNVLIRAMNKFAGYILMG